MHENVVHIPTLSDVCQLSRKLAERLDTTVPMGIDVVQSRSYQSYSCLIFCIACVITMHEKVVHLPKLSPFCQLSN